ncbi:TKL protein kinase [Saprolegnia parasitica CBS 223.65]|uniref:TKL protein kinase n=1 Tax=Saprolegnia parasitica (strain CBS 223.65) TaxID=695850 RepID=A0A067CH07_SAPPC|nr:TKL protein kinase [Saprolegnia parasitica CBS 223.65]KDO29763.1 TKL protein kinase [Saprolegnia parasitica CBS 223.65]|eukprot:XP_012199411.1 TKL protein kinase [Saprolegnia parasitica CBS 223.65]
MDLVVKVPQAHDLRSSKFFGSVKRPYALLRYAHDSAKTDVDPAGREAPRWTFRHRFARINPAAFPYLEVDVYDMDAHDGPGSAIGTCEIPVPTSPSCFQQWFKLSLNDKITGYIYIVLEVVARRRREGSSQRIERRASDSIERRATASMERRPERRRDSVISTASSSGSSGSASAKSKALQSSSSSLSASFLQRTASLPETIPRIDPAELRVRSALGRGAYGSVALCIYKKRHVAVKTFHVTSGNVNGDDHESFAKEVGVMYRLSSFYTVQLLGISHNEHDQPQIVMEYMSGGNLHEHLKLLGAANKEHDVTSLLYIALSVAKGLVYLHDQGIIHRDLKPANVLLSDDKVSVKLGDFGISRQYDVESMTNGIGTTPWMAPEVISSGNYTVQADIYSFGILLTELETLKPPYAGEKCSPFVLQGKVLNGYRPSLRPTVPTWYKRLVASCVAGDPTARPTAAEIVEILTDQMPTARRAALSVATLPQIPPSDVAPVGIVGGNAFSSVARGIYGDRMVAIKTFLTLHPSRIEAEANRMARFASEHTVELLGLSGSTLVMECMLNGNLRQFLAQKARQAWPAHDLRNVLYVAVALAKALAFLHANDQVHGSLVPTNVLFDAKGVVKLSDFGYDRDDDNVTINGASTMAYMAPEVLLGQPPSFPADIFALGVLFTQLETLQEPYADNHSTLTKKVAQVSAGLLRPTLSPSCPAWFRDLALLCMAQDPAHRPSAAGVVQLLSDNMQ